MHQMVSEIATSVERSAAKIEHAVSRKLNVWLDSVVNVTFAVGHEPAEGTLLEIAPSADMIGEAPIPV
jgi:hypothetical protein